MKYAVVWKRKNEYWMLLNPNKPIKSIGGRELLNFRDNKRFKTFVKNFNVKVKMVSTPDYKIVRGRPVRTFKKGDLPFPKLERNVVR